MTKKSEIKVVEIDGVRQFVRDTTDDGQPYEEALADIPSDERRCVHAEEGDPQVCPACETFTPVDEDDTVDKPNPALNLQLPPNPIDPSKLRPRGVHLKGTGLSFFMGEGNCRQIDVAQNEQGLLLVRVQYTGNRKARVFEITPLDLIMEFKEVEVEIVRV